MTDPELVLSLRYPLRGGFGLLCVVGLASWGGVFVAVTETPTSDPEPKVVPEMRLVAMSRPSLSKPIMVTCYVRNADPHQRVTLRFHYSLKLQNDDTPTKGIGFAGDAGYAAVTWRLQATQNGEFKLTAVTIDAAPASTVIHIRPICLGIFE